MNMFYLLGRTVRRNGSRNILSALTIAIGCVLVFGLVAGLHALSVRSERLQWRSAAFSAQSQQPIAGVAPLYIKLATGNIDMWRDRSITYTGLFASGPTSPTLPQFATPQPGQCWFSPELDRLMRAHPEAQLLQRFGRENKGILPRHLLPSPDSLSVICGMDESVAKQSANAAYSIDRKSTNGAQQLIGGVIFIGALGILIPALLLASVAIRLGTAQREQRYAAMRLVGATMKQIRLLLMLETLVGTLAGITLGYFGYLALRPAFARIHFDGSALSLPDFRVAAVPSVGIVLLILALSLATTWWSTRRSYISPLGVARRSIRTGKTRIWRMLPLVIGIGLFVWARSLGTSWIRTEANSSLAVLLIGSAFLLVTLGFLLAGPLLTRIAADFAGRLTQRAPTLLAVRAIAAKPHETFRAVGGLVIALFMGSFYLATVSGVDDREWQLAEQNGFAQLRDRVVLVTANELSPTIEQHLGSIKGVSQVTPLYFPKATTDEIVSNDYGFRCEDLKTFTLLQCVGSDSAWQTLNFYNFRALTTVNGTIQNVQAQKAVEQTSIDTSKPVGYIALMDSNDRIDTVRSVVAQTTPVDARDTLLVRNGTYEKQPNVTPLIRELASLVYLAFALTIFMATVSLLISTAGALYERKRMLFTLRLGGFRLRELQRTVLLQAMIPLFTVAIVAGGLGLALGSLTINVLARSISARITPMYGVVVCGALCVAVAGLQTLLPMVKRATMIETNRME